MQKILKLHDSCNFLGFKFFEEKIQFWIDFFFKWRKNICMHKVKSTRWHGHCALGSEQSTFLNIQSISSPFQSNTIWKLRCAPVFHSNDSKTLHSMNFRWDEMIWCHWNEFFTDGFYRIIYYCNSIFFFLLMQSSEIYFVLVCYSLRYDNEGLWNE